MNWSKLPAHVRKILKAHILPGRRIYVPKSNIKHVDARDVRRRDRLIRLARASGASLRAIAGEFHLSHTRVLQILEKKQSIDSAANGAALF